MPVRPSAMPVPHDALRLRNMSCAAAALPLRGLAPREEGDHRKLTPVEGAVSSTAPPYSFACCLRTILAHRRRSHSWYLRTHVGLPRHARDTARRGRARWIECVQ